MDITNLPKVTSSKLFIRHGKSTKFHPEGLYSEKIFGPLESWTCWCNDYVFKKEGEKCPKCGIPYTTSLLRRNQHAVIELSQEIISGLTYILIKRGPKLIKNLYTSIKSNNAVIFNKANMTPKQVIKLVDLEDDIEEKDDELVVKSLLDIPKALEVLKDIHSYQKNEIVQTLYRLVEIGRFFCKHVIVIPPDLRPIISENIIDEISVKYQAIVLHEELTKNQVKGKLITEISRNSLQNAVDDLRDVIIEKLKGKEGLLRGAAGKRCDWTGRATIVPSLNESFKISMPYVMALEIFRMDITKSLTNKLQLPFNSIIEYINEVKNDPNTDKVPREIKEKIKQTLNRLLEKEIFIINRQPTLHRGSMFAVRAETWDHLSIGLPRTLCDPMNADFDGDSVVGTVTLYNEEGKEVFKGHLSKLFEQHCQTLSHHLNKTTERRS